MFSKRKGNNINGWIIIDKPAGITSTNVVNKIKRAFNAKKVGHAGTLDPDATGVLPIALGEATKTIPHIMDEIKSYHFCIKFGEATDTDDATGEIIYKSNKRPDDDKISALLPKYTGFIEQKPPNYSAIKVNGVRAYDLARSGKQLKLRARSLFVKELKFLERVDEDHALLQLTCGKGGYVRSIARDLGTDLKCFAHVWRTFLSFMFCMVFLKATLAECLAAFGIRGNTGPWLNFSNSWTSCTLGFGVWLWLGPLPKASFNLLYKSGLLPVVSRPKSSNAVLSSSTFH